MGAPRKSNPYASLFSKECQNNRVSTCTEGARPRPSRVHERLDVNYKVNPRSTSEPHVQCRIIKEEVCVALGFVTRFQMSHQKHKSWRKEEFIKIRGTVPLMKSSTQIGRSYCQGISDKGLLSKCRKKSYNSAIGTQTYPLDVGLGSEYAPPHRSIQMTDNRMDRAFH